MLDTDAIRDEFNPERGSVLWMRLNALDGARRRRDEARPEFERLRDELDETKRQAKDSSLDPLSIAQARSMLDPLRDALRAAQRRYERARGDARKAQAEATQIVRKLRVMRGELEEHKAYLAESTGLSEEDWRAMGYTILQTEARRRLQRVGAIERHMAEMLELEGQRQTA